MIEIGGETLDLLVSAIRDGAGNYVGPMLTWSVVTEKVKIDAKAAQLEQMVEQMPVGVMMCDTENFEINYLNKFSIETLKTLEQHLPVKVDDMIGQTIDVFHKVPEHQRKHPVRPVEPAPSGAHRGRRRDARSPGHADQR